MDIMTQDRVCKTQEEYETLSDMYCKRANAKIVYESEWQIQILYGAHWQYEITIVRPRHV